MQIICEFCGASVNIKEDDICPNCGASFADNKDYQERKQIELEREKLKNQKQKQELDRHNQVEHQRRQQIQLSKRSPVTNLIVFLIVCGIIFSFITFASIIASIGEMFEDPQDDVHNVIENPTKPDEPEETEPIDPGPQYVTVSGKVNELINNGVYDLKIDEIKEITRYPFTPKKDHTYIAVHFVITNRYKESMKLYEKYVNLTADGVQQASYWDSTYYDMSSNNVSPNLSIEGYEVWEIPVNFENIQIFYGNYITIDVTPEDIVWMSTEVQ